MTEPHPAFVPYATAMPDARDADHVRILSLMHYVWGGLVMLFSSVFILHVVFGLLMAHGGGPFVATGPGGPPPPPASVGYVMAGFGGCAVACGWTLGAMNLLVGRRLARHRSRTLAMVVDAVNCVWVPLGTVLGVFTFIVLGRASVRAMFASTTPPIG